MAAIMLIPAMSNQNAFATIVGFPVCSILINGCEITESPPNPVAKDPNEGILLVWDEVQNVALSQDLRVDRVADESAPFIGEDAGGFFIKAGTIVSSHYVQWDNGSGSSNTVDAVMQFDSDIFAFITSDQKLFGSDDELGLPGLDYNDFGSRGFEGSDTTNFNGKFVGITATATSPGDWARLITAFSPAAEPEQQDNNGGDNAWNTRPTFGLGHENNQPLVENGFTFNDNSFTMTDNHHTDFAEQAIEIGATNTFSATVYADKQLKIQEFLFGIPTVGEAHLAELGVEVWYDVDGEIDKVVVVQDSDVIDADTVSVSHEKTKCIAADAEAKCDTTTVSMTFLEPLLDKVMAIKAIDWKLRDQRTFLNEGFDVSGESLNPMLSNMIPSTVRDEGLLKVSQVAKYSPYWESDDGRIFEMNSFVSFKQINQSFERFQDTGTAYTRMHSGFGGIIANEQNRSLDVFDSSKYISELPDSFAYIYPETGQRISDEMRQEMLVQEEKAKQVLDEMDRQERHY